MWRGEGRAGLWEGGPVQDARDRKRERVREGRGEGMVGCGQG